MPFNVILGLCFLLYSLCRLILYNSFIENILVTGKWSKLIFEQTREMPMGNFITYSIIGSIVLTIALNVLPLLFPNAATKLQKKMEENAKRAIEQHEDDNQPRVKVFFPWKAMLIGSLVLTVLVNLIGYFSR